MKAPRTLILLAGLALALLGAITWLEWRDATRAPVVADQVARTREVQTNLRGLLSQLQDIEIGAQAFVVTPDPAFRERFTIARGIVNNELFAVRTLTRDNPDQQAHCDVLERLIARHLALVQTTVDLRRDSGFEAAQQHMAGMDGKAVTDQIRAEIAAMNDQEQALRSQRSAVVRSQRRYARALIAAGSGLSFVLLATAFTCLWVENRRRHEAEQKLREFSDQLEQHAHELTKELTYESEKSRQAEEGFRIIVRAIIDYAIVMLDSGGHVISWNPGAARLKGYREEEIVGQHFARFYPDEDIAHGKPGTHLEEASAGGRVEDEGWRVRKDGTRFWANVVITALRDEGGSLRGFVKVTRDMTARKRSEQALRTSEQLLAQSQRLAHLGNWMADLEMETLTWSEELYRICGISPEAFVPTLDAFLALIHQDDKAVMRSHIDALRSGIGPRAIEFRVVRPDGTIRVIEGSGEIQVNAENKPIRVVGTAHDITGRKEVEQALCRSLDLLDQTGQIAAVGGWELDVGTQTLRWTKETSRIHEVDPAVQPSVAEAIRFYAPEARSVIAAAVQTAIDAGTPFDLELPLVTATGRRIWVRAQGIAERRGDKTTRLYGAFQDITERRTTDESQRLQSAALQAAADAIIITDRAGIIEWVNPSFTRMTGYSFQEALGRNPRDLLKSGNHSAAFFQEFWKTILAGDTWHGEMINRRKDGRLYTEDQIVAPIRDVSGAITHFVAVKKDVTERLQLEAQLRQAQKMESVGRLVSGIAHDFNNLLTVINGMSDVVIKQLDKHAPERADVQEILSAGQRAARLTHQLLAFSRQQILEPRILNVNMVVTGMEDLLQRLLGEDIDLAVVPAPALASVKADRGQLEQVITNLAVNARDAMPHGGRITIETQNVTIDEHYARQCGDAVSPGPYVMLSVTDSGGGMDEETRTRIFEPFFTTKGPGRGTGLGLSTAYGIIRQSDGFISVYSEIGQGTTFKIYLPQMAEEGVVDRPEPIAVASSGSETILLVEDHPALRRLAARVLEPVGYTVLGATTGEEALRLMAHHGAPIHLLLSDVVMPGMSGRELAQRVAQTHPEMKVLYMSGYTDDTIVRHGVLDAHVPFLNKPFAPAALLRKVRDVLDS